MRNITLLLILLLPVHVWAEYKATELCVIKWDGEGYSLFSKMAVNDPGTPEIASDDYIEPTRGPHIAIVDVNENIIVASRELQQLVGFNNSSELIFNFSHKVSGYTPDIFEYIPEIIYVDTLSRLYIVTSPPLEYVPVVNYNYEVLGKINPFNWPFSHNPHLIINLINPAPDGTMFFRNPKYGWVTFYGNGESVPGGSNDFYANDGYFYHLYKINNTVIEFQKSGNPDSHGVPKSRAETRVNIGSEIVSSAKLMNGGNGDFLYVYLKLAMKGDYVIRQYDLKYNLIDKIELSIEPAYEDWIVKPFVRRDGNIYEFRTREDGLHIIRWSKD